MEIISGTLKGKKIPIIKKYNDDFTLRPTTNYVKQVLFNLLNNNSIVKFDFKDKTVLDACCGTGIVGFEFFSRGAGHITFLDSNRDNIKQIIRNCTSNNISFGILYGFLPKLEIKNKFDIIFLDPPYSDGPGKVFQMVRELLDNNLMENGILILESVGDNKHFNSKINDIMTKKSLTERLILTYKCSSKTNLIFFR